MITGFDWAVFGICFLSTILGLWRGMIKEIISLLCWVGSLILAWYFIDDVSNFLLSYINNDALTSIISFFIIFGLSFGVFSIIGRFINFSTSTFIMIDKIMGALFGLMRGVIIMSLVYIVIVSIWEHNLPDNVRNAETQPIISHLSDLLIRQVSGPSTLGGDVEEQGVIDEFLQGFQNLPLSDDNSSLGSSVTDMADTIANYASIFASDTIDFVSANAASVTAYVMAELNNPNSDFNQYSGDAINYMGNIFDDALGYVTNLVEGGAVVESNIVIDDITLPAVE